MGAGQAGPSAGLRLDHRPRERGSLTDLTCQLRTPATAAEVNATFAAAAHDRLAGVLPYTELPVVSRDVLGDPASCGFDASLTQASGPLVKLFGDTTTSGATPTAWST